MVTGASVGPCGWEVEACKGFLEQDLVKDWVWSEEEETVGNIAYIYGLSRKRHCGPLTEMEGWRVQGSIGVPLGI